MREVTGHTSGRIFLWILGLSAVWYVFVLPFVLQNSTYLLFGWMPLVVFFYTSQTTLWLIAFWIYTAKYWPYR